jgi:transcriptional regulator
MHGYAISEWIDDATRSVLLVEEGTLYPALHRLERRGWIASEWGVSENNRKAKFYSMTLAGRARLRAESRVWQRNADAIAAVLRRNSPSAS